MDNFSELENKIGINFKNKNLLKQAFCHRSYLNEKKDALLENNERLEFLGDAVLELIVTDYLYKNYRNPEGELTGWRAYLVNSKNLAKIAKNLGFEKCLLLSKGEAKGKGKGKMIILGNAFEAFLGALFLDQGYEVAEKFVVKNLLAGLPKKLKSREWEDSKSRLQEIVQERTKTTPVYKILKEWGPDHNKQFIAGVFVADKLLAQGSGFSKQEAEEKAAEKALSESIFKDDKV